ncbi:hypothetical protein BH23VER1_BH23VER1_15010 [soil metagenome]
MIGRPFANPEMIYIFFPEVGDHLITLVFNPRLLVVGNWIILLHILFVERCNSHTSDCENSGRGSDKIMGKSFWETEFRALSTPA